MTKPRIAAAVEFPPAFHSAGEQHPFLAKYKRSLEKRLSLTRMDPLFEEVDLSIYLLALGRSSEALQVASFLPSEIEFTGNHNIWSPVGYALTTSAYLLRIADRHEVAAAQLARLIESPSYSEREPEFYRRELAERIPKALDEGWNDTSTKWACHILARTVMVAIYWRETNLKGFPNHGRYTNEAAERCRDLGLERLRTRLDGKAKPAA